MRDQAAKGLFATGLFWLAVAIPLHGTWPIITPSIVLIVLGALLHPWGHWHQSMQRNRHILLMAFYVLLHILALSWSPSRIEGLEKIFLRLPLLLLPPAFILMDPRQNLVSRVRWAFIFSTSIISLFLLARGAVLWSVGNGWPVYLTFSPFVHPAYLAMAVGSSIFLLFGSQRKESSTLSTAKVAAIAILLVTLMSLSSRAQILSVLGIGTLWAITVVIRRSGERRTLAYVALALIVIVPLGYGQLMKNARMRQGVAELHNLETDDVDETSTGSRIILWRESLDLALAQPWGYGTGHGKEALTQRLADIGRVRLALKHPNTHNQYLGDVLSVGVQGCLALILMLLVPALATRHSAVAGTIPVIALISMSLITESMLERQTGVALVAFLITILTYRPAHAES